MKQLLRIVLMIGAASSCMAAVSHAPVSLNAPMVADISQTSIQIHSSFTGMQLLIFGARNVPGDLVIAVRGPSANVTLRRKERIAGMWMHVGQQKYEQLPMFYALAATRPLRLVAPAAMLQQLGLGERNVIHTSNVAALADFDEALQETLNTSDNWQEPFGDITFFGESLFKARLDMPDRLPRGNYTVEIYLFSNGELAGFQTIPLVTYKTGIDARVYDEAQQQPFLYGILAILMALSGGWLAHRLFHRD